MPTKMVDYKRNRAVIVSVYEERPKMKRPSSNSNGDRRRRHCVHHNIKVKGTLRKPGEAGEGYDRRAELLLYSQRLREAVRPALDVDVVVETSPLEPKPTSSKNQQHPENVVAVQPKPKLTRTASSPSCPCFLPSFITKSLTSQQAKKPTQKKQQNGTTNNAMKAVMKRLQMPKKTRGFISKLLFPLQKKR